MPNKKKAKQKSKQQNTNETNSTPRNELVDEASLSQQATEGTYVRYKRSTQVVHDWCDRLAGASATLRDWATAMEKLAKRGEQMPAAVMHALEQAILLRDEANAFYRDMQAALERQQRHWHVCRLLRFFRRLFRRRSASPPAQTRAETECPSGCVPRHFEALDIEEPAEGDEGAGDEFEAAQLDAPEEEAPADERVFALACLMADAARAREEVRAAWASWTPVAHEHGVSLLGATCQANLAVTKLDRIVNATQMLVDLPDVTLASLLACASPPRVQLRNLQGRPELNGQRGVLGARDTSTGRYVVALDSGRESVRVKIANITPEHGWAAGTESLVGILHEVGRAIEAFGTVSPTSGNILYCEDHSRQLECLATEGCMHAWICYGEGNGNLGSYGAGESAWRRALRGFQVDKRRPSFTFAFMVLGAVDCNVDAAKRLKDRLMANPTQVMEELRFYHSQVCGGVREVAQLTEMRQPATKRLMESYGGQCEAVEELLEPVVLTTVQSCPWLAGDVLFTGAHLALTLTSNVIWVSAMHLRVMVHVYHLMRCRGRLLAIPAVDSFLRVFRRSVFFRLEQLPAKGGFRKALGLSIGASVTGHTDKAVQTVLDHRGQNLAEISLLYYVTQFVGAGLDLEQLDFQAIARDEVAVLHRASHLSGMARLLQLEEQLMSAGCRPQDLVREADLDASDEWPALAERAVKCCEQVFPGCSRSPPGPDAAVTLVFSSYAHIAPVQSHSATTASSYAPTTERVSREEMKAKLREGIARNKALARGR